MIKNQHQSKTEYTASEWEERESIRREQQLNEHAERIVPIAGALKHCGIRRATLLTKAALALGIPDAITAEVVKCAVHKGLLVKREVSGITFFYLPKYAPPPDASLYLDFVPGVGTVAKVRGNRKKNKRVLQSEFIRN